jgi:hypothetical protein
LADRNLMIARIFGFLAAAFAAASLAQPVQEMPSRALTEGAVSQEFFRASHLPATAAVKLAAPAQKALPTVDKRGRLQIGTVRPLAQRSVVREWATIPEGSVSRLTASSEGAEGLRVRLDVGQLAAPIEVRAQGTDGKIEFRRVEPSQGPEAWTPWTAGSTQTIEIFSAGELPQVAIGALAHFDASPFAKAAAECTLPTSCTTNNATLDAAIAERTKSSVRLIFNEGSGAFVCSGTLLNTERFPAGYVLTANHCISTPASAASVTAMWFYESISCTDTAVTLGAVQQSGGAQIVFTNYNPDSTLLLMRQTPPAGAVYSGWSATLLNEGDPVVSISHPQGDTARLATGSMTHLYGITDRSQEEYGVRFDRGIIQGGSSGSGLYTLAGGSLQLRGVLTGTTIRHDPQGMSCTNLDEEAFYGRFDIFYPQMAQYLRPTGPVADDTPNRVLDYASLPAEATPLNGRTVTFDRRFEYVGDVDVFRFTLSAPATVTLGSQGTLDTIGTLLDADGEYIDTNDDKNPGGTNLNFGMTRDLQPGTYYLMVAPFEVTDVGSYRVVMTASSAVVNYTDLWWNSSESGWGLNLAHQGDILFATLYTYDTFGNPLWLFMSNGAKQSDGSYSGTIARATGPAFNANPWTPINAVTVGTMRITFTSSNSATLVYTFNGVSVTKGITRFQFSTPTTCFLTTGDRASATNYQDLWWNPAESGWGVNLAHQGNVLFATLYTYDARGAPMWLAMSSGQLIGNRTYQGPLHRYSGPAFNASPWAPPVTPFEVGTMRFTFTDGKSGTLTYSMDGVTVSKSITRYEFSDPKPQCNS